ncbi:restriction endonuclease subunit S [Bradyrhizobium sp. CCGE-LA001]|uniref:restriction endonuclease subunit S n=1 Tax=Bradyrhizobium sp. CCGE-LA001 TaxID=1223566 RepID=UPI0002AA75CF|nr:restriction endonuclease subunit S [Bradyrhizobium sp. CCGE-LA001]AMA60596.1 hypothetical protein BCCGELA001_33230 [Bradyrhizobium sp. CCGE-LA001]
MSYPQKHLGELCNIVIGRTPSRGEPSYWGGGNKWVSISDLISKIVSDTKEEITDIAVTAARCRRIAKGTLLFSFKLTIGKMAFAGCDLFTNEAIAALEIKDKNSLSNDYLYYALKSARIEGSNQAVMGKTLNSRSLAEIAISVPERLDDQIRIARLFGKVEGLIAERKQHLEQLDVLLKSVFLHMFGDPVRNEKEWKKKAFSTLLNEIESGKSPTCEARPALAHEWGVLKLGAVTSCYFDERENKALPNETLPSDRYEVKAGDLLFSRKNTYALVAACAYVFSTRPKLLMPDLVFRFVFRDDAEVHPIYMWKLLTAKSQRTKIQSLAAGAAGSMPNISKTNLREVQLPIPPLPLQSKFADIVTKVEGLKSKYQKSLRDLEELYGALRQRAFSGELDLSRVSLPESPMNGEQALVSDVLQAIATPAINLPDTDLLVAALENRELVKDLLHLWLDSYHRQLSGEAFSLERFLAAAQTRLAELHPDTDFELGNSDYEHIKNWAFDALASGKLMQTYDETNKLVQLQAG